MDYLKVTFSFARIEDYQKDLMIADLADTGFETFEDTANGFDAFVQKAVFSESALMQLIADYEEIQMSYNIENIETENWNATWENNFNPLVIKDECYVRATFHEAQPQYRYEIIIDPKMAFGTGHHQTTTLMMQYILETEMTDKNILDMGAGTAILAILAAKCGAKYATAIDYDEICYESAVENAKLNGIKNLTSLCGSKEAIPNQVFDVIFANINRNILLDQIHSYAAVLAKNGQIFFSGFYESPDLEMIEEECHKHGLKYVSHKKMGDWVATKFVNQQTEK